MAFKPFVVELKPILDEIEDKQKAVQAFADMATIEIIKSIKSLVEKKYYRSRWLINTQ